MLNHEQTEVVSSKLMERRNGMIEWHVYFMFVGRRLLLFSNRNFVLFHEVVFLLWLSLTKRIVLFRFRRTCSKHHLGTIFCHSTGHCENPLSQRCSTEWFVCCCLGEFNKWYANTQTSTQTNTSVRRNIFPKLSAKLSAIFRLPKLFLCFQKNITLWEITYIYYALQYSFLPRNLN